MPRRSPRQVDSKTAAVILDMSPDDVVMLARKGKIEGRKRGKFWSFNLQHIRELREQFGSGYAIE